MNDEDQQMTKGGECLFGPTQTHEEDTETGNAYG
jgi:hypothetical protein